ncbi:MAG: hypothetical protein ACWGHH_06740 [Sulfurovaceae bacterium]
METRIIAILSKPKYEQEIIKKLYPNCNKSQRVNAKKWISFLMGRDIIKIENGRYILCKTEG